jgi:hypothetical protein
VARLRPSLAIALAALCAGGCSRAVQVAPFAPNRADSSAIGFRGAARCSSLQFRAQAAPELPASPLHELVVAVNGQICHREGIPGHAIAHGELIALCGDAPLEPGLNRVDVALVPPGCGARRAVARGSILCAAPEPD